MFIDLCLDSAKYLTLESNGFNKFKLILTLKALQYCILKALSLKSDAHSLHTCFLENNKIRNDFFLFVVKLVTYHGKQMLDLVFFCLPPDEFRVKTLDF